MYLGSYHSTCIYGYLVVMFYTVEAPIPTYPTHCPFALDRWTGLKLSWNSATTVNNSISSLRAKLVIAWVI